MKKDYISGTVTKINENLYYKISNYTDMKPFLFTLATSSDLWIHLSTYGGISAGRRNSDNSIFPYYPEDILHHSTDTGAKTIIRAFNDNSEYLWQPFDTSYIKKYATERNIYKNIIGNSVIFEEKNLTLNMTFRYEWTTSNKYGFVRTSELINHGDILRAEVIDGLINIIPYGVSESLQKGSSCMVDGYKRAELYGDKGGAVYSLTSDFNDVPEALEILKATVFWNTADFDTDIYFYENALNDFVSGAEFEKARRYIGERSCYLMNFDVDFITTSSHKWSIVCDTGIAQNKIEKLFSQLPDIDVFGDVKNSAHMLKNIIAMTDGLQLTDDKLAYIHHISNVTYNDMRGGVFMNGYRFDYDDFVLYLKKKNTLVYEKNIEYLNSIKATATIPELKSMLLRDNNLELYRLLMEYIPVSFSRRHGDPSRPWNTFSIELTDAQGNPITYYAGNWRDIFQNWEALCISYPEFYENTIVKFLNCSSLDGFNPIRIDKFGMDWDDPSKIPEWAALGYFGDHQIIYLIRLIDNLKNFCPSSLERLFSTDIFTYADIPYELAEFDDMIKNPKWTISFNNKRHVATVSNSEKNGEDFKTILQNDRPYCVSFTEKLAVQAMSKISNLVIGGGVWMNTQKAEWNDANNAIVGYGLSMVTTCQLYHYLVSLTDILENHKNETVNMTGAVYEWLLGITRILNKNIDLIHNKSIDDTSRFSILREFGQCFDEYKNNIYTYNLKNTTECTIGTVLDMFKLALPYIEYTIRENKRIDGLYNSYNIMEIGENAIQINPLMKMLEGQVSVLECGILDSDEAVSLLTTMKNSDLYSEKEKTYYLYPVNHLPEFMSLNIIPEKYMNTSKLIHTLINTHNNSLVLLDESNTLRFNSSIVSVTALKARLDDLAEDPHYNALVTDEYEMILECFEKVFSHSSFIGRSQIMYKYEGIGCIYWHQNSKLRVAVEETLLRAIANNENTDTLTALKSEYHKICEGLCYRKSPSQWGAFPIDDYSHTPYSGGASQPVMTGQVKEDVLARFAELGITFNNGTIVFRPAMIDNNELLHNESVFDYIDISGNNKQIKLSENSYSLTLCQTPIICSSIGLASVTVKFSDGTVYHDTSSVVPAEISQKIFSRSGIVSSVEFTF